MIDGGLCGAVMGPRLNFDDIFSHIEVAETKPNGKEICEILRKKREELAALNNIKYKSEPCINTEPCSGTCPQCEAEAEYINRELRKIARKQRKYPELDSSDGNWLRNGFLVTDNDRWWLF